MNGTDAKNSEKVGLFQIVILILSIVVLGALGVDTVFKLPKEVSDILQTLDTLVCVLLLADFGFRLYKAESKLAFLKWGCAFVPPASRTARRRVFGCAPARVGNCRHQTRQRF